MVREHVRIRHDELSPGSHGYDTLPFLQVDVELPDTPPERREARRVLKEHLLAVVNDRLGEEVERIRMEAFSGDSVHPTVAVAYLDDLTVVPMWIDGDRNGLTGIFDMGDAVQVHISPSNVSSSRTRWTPTDDMAEWMIGGIPSRWKALFDAPKKAQFLEDQLAKNSSVSQADPVAAVEEWRTLLEVEGTAGGDPLTDAQLEEFVATTGLDMPAELEAILRVANGAARLGINFMGSDEIVHQWKEWKVIFDSRPLVDLTDSYKCPTDEVVPIYCNPRWIPLVEERTGNYAAIDLLPGENGRAGQIIYFGADESLSLRVIATDLTDLLRRQREFVTADGYRAETHGRIYYLPRLT